MGEGGNGDPSGEAMCFGSEDGRLWNVGQGYGSRRVTDCVGAVDAVAMEWRRERMEHASQVRPANPTTWQGVVFVV